MLASINRYTRLQGENRVCLPFFFGIPIPFHSVIFRISRTCASDPYCTFLWNATDYLLHTVSSILSKRNKSLLRYLQGYVYSMVPIADVTTTMIIVSDKHSKPPGSKTAVCLQTAAYWITFASVCITKHDFGTIILKLKKKMKYIIVLYNI